MRTCILGAGAWGAALAKVLHENEPDFAKAVG
jgi:glycerol-3-phosphate dehydrogenase